MSGYSWRVDKANSVSIEIALDSEGSASFTLTAITPSGDTFPVTIISNPGAAGKALFQLAPREVDVLLKLQVECFSPGPPGAAVWLSVTQNDTIVTCQDDSDKVINANGGGFGPVQIGTVKQGDTKSFQFTAEIAEPANPAFLATARARPSKPSKAPAGSLKRKAS